MTRQQAENAHRFHYGECKKIVGPRGGTRVRIEEWRRNGATKTWKTRPHAFRIPIKYGLKGYTYLDETNAHHFHAAEDCPLNTEA